MVRINISLAEDLFDELVKKVPPGKRSRFIAEILNQVDRALRLHYSLH